MRFSVLASGSGGNACYVETARSRVLIDAGLSCRELMRRLKLIGADPAGLDALILTHEHLDHIRGAGPIARRLNLPVFGNRATLQKGMKIMGTLSKPVVVHTGQPITFNGLLIETFTKCHDAADPMGLVVSSDGVKLGVITDLGRSTGVVEDRLRECRGLIIESNHDVRMLEEGPYPLELKRRIKGPDGHLSNGQAVELLKTLSHKGLDVVVLAHLSEKNNLPDMAFAAARECLVKCGRSATRIVVSRQDSPAPLIDLA